MVFHWFSRLWEGSGFQKSAKKRKKHQQIVLRTFREHLGTSWERLGASWEHLGSVLERLGSDWTPFFLEKWVGRCLREPRLDYVYGSDGTANKIQHAFAQGAGGLFTLRESRRGAHELCEHGSDRRETSAKRVSDDLQLSIFWRQNFFFEKSFRFFFDFHYFRQILEHLVNFGRRNQIP